MWLMNSPFPILMILTAYLYFVLKFGPEFMKYRNPFNINRVVMIYNVVQVLLSLYLVKEVTIVLNPGFKLALHRNRGKSVNRYSYSRQLYNDDDSK